MRRLLFFIYIGGLLLTNYHFASAQSVQPKLIVNILIDPLSPTWIKQLEENLRTDGLFAIIQ